MMGKKRRIPALEVDSDWMRGKKRRIPVLEVDSDWIEILGFGCSYSAGSPLSLPVSVVEDCRTSDGMFQTGERRRANELEDGDSLWVRRRVGWKDEEEEEQ